MRRLALVPLLALAACSLPIQGGVTTVRTVGVQQPAQAEPQVIPPGPVTGADPAAVVAGFVRAETDVDVAAEFLTSAEAWTAAGATTVYAATAGPTIALVEQPTDPAQPDTQPDPAQPDPAQPDTRPDPARTDLAQADGLRTATVTLSVTRTAVVPEGAELRPATGTLAQQFSLRRADGEWRIDSAPAGRLVTDRALRGATRPATVYFTSVDGTQLVGETVVLAGRPTDLPTEVVRTLLDGVPARLTGVVATSIPSGSDLIGVVVVSSGVAQVDLTSRVRAGGQQNLDTLRAQVTATLLSVPAVTGVRISVEGDPLPGGDGPFTAKVLDGLDPDASTPDDSWVVRDGRVVPLSGAVASLPATSVPDGTPVSVSVRDGVVAVVRRPASGPTTVWVDGPDGTSARRPQLDGARAVAWTQDGALLVLSAAGVLQRALGDAAPVALPLTAGPGTAPADGQAFDGVQLAPDGVHLALSTTVGQVWTGALGPASSPAVADLHLAVTSGGPLVSWAGSRALVVVSAPSGPGAAGSLATAARIEVVDLAYAVGSDQPAVCGDGGPSALAASPGHPLLAACPATADSPESVEQLDTGGVTWRKVADGSLPAWGR